MHSHSSSSEKQRKLTISSVTHTCHQLDKDEAQRSGNIKRCRKYLRRASSTGSLLSMFSFVIRDFRDLVRMSSVVLAGLSLIVCLSQEEGKGRKLLSCASVSTGCQTTTAVAHCLSFNIY